MARAVSCTVTLNGRSPVEVSGDVACEHPSVEAPSSLKAFIGMMARAE